jgi:antitoxin component of MazEF toxin-antitoxin module
MMLLKIMKSGNSATLRIPTDTLKQLNLSIGDEVFMSTTEHGFSFEKAKKARDGWFIHVTPVCAEIEAKQMENDFSATHDDNLDDWTQNEEW